jgi:hypothetical protein
MCAGLLIGYVPLAGWLARRTAAVQREDFWLPPATPAGLLSALRSHVIFHLPRIAALPYLALLCLGAAAPWLSRKKPLGRDRESSDGSGWTLVVLWAACPLLLPYAYSRLAAPILWPRYTIAASPAICLLIARGALALPRALPAAAVAALSLLSAMSLSRARASQQEDWRSAVARLGALSAEPDVIVPCPFYVQDPLRYYYRGKAAIFPLRLAPDLETAPPNDIEAALAGRRRAWLLMRVEARHRGRRLLPDILRERRGVKMTHVEDFGHGVYLAGFDLSP